LKFSKYNLTLFWQVKITARDIESLEKSKTIIANLTMVPKVGEIFRCPFVLSLGFYVHMIYSYCSIALLLPVDLVKYLLLTEHFQDLANENS
jgi:hypothetical protein